MLHDATANLIKKEYTIHYWIYVFIGRGRTMNVKIVKFIFSTFFPQASTDRILKFRIGKENKSIFCCPVLSKKITL